MSARGYAAIGLHNPKTPHNVGSVLRAAHCYGVAMVAHTGQRYRGAPTDTMKAWRHLPLLQTEDLHALIPHDCVPVAIDILPGARAGHLSAPEKVRIHVQAVVARGSCAS